MPAATRASRIWCFRRPIICREHPTMAAASTAENKDNANAVSRTISGSTAMARSRSIRNWWIEAEVGPTSAIGISRRWRPCAKRYRNMDVNSLSIRREAKVWIDALSPSNLGQRAINVRTSWLSTSSRSSIAMRQRCTNARAFRPARFRTAGSAWSRVTSATTAPFCPLSCEFDFHCEWKSMTDFKGADFPRVHLAHVVKKLRQLLPKL